MLWYLQLLSIEHRWSSNNFSNYVRCSIPGTNSLLYAYVLHFGRAGDVRYAMPQWLQVCASRTKWSVIRGYFLRWSVVCPFVWLRVWVVSNGILIYIFHRALFITHHLSRFSWYTNLQCRYVMLYARVHTAINFFLLS